MTLQELAERFILLKEKESTIKAELDDLRNQIALAMDEDQLKEYNALGKTLHLRQGRTTYSFKNIQEWVEKKEELNEIEKKYKAVALNDHRQLMSISSDGEVLESPVITKSNPTISIK